MKIRWWNFWVWKKVAVQQLMESVDNARLNEQSTKQLIFLREEIRKSNSVVQSYMQECSLLREDNTRLEIENNSLKKEIERLNNLLTPKRTEAPRDSKLKGWAKRV